jgi:hypothetical protein
MNGAVTKRLRADLSLASCSMLGGLIVLAGILVAEMLGPPAAPESHQATATGSPAVGVVRHVDGVVHGGSGGVRLFVPMVMCLDSVPLPRR